MNLLAPDLTDEQCLQKYSLSNDRSGLETLINRHFQRAYRIAYKQLGDSAAADDAVQEAFVSLINSCRRFKAGSQFSPWWNTILFNAIRKEARRRQRRLKHEANAANEASTAIELEVPDLTGVINDHLSRLPTDLRDALTLHFFDGLSHNEVAQQLNLPKSTVSSRIKKGVETLRSALKRSGYGLTVVALTAALTNISEGATPAFTLPTVKTLEAIAQKKLAGMLLLKAAMIAMAVLASILLILPKDVGASSKPKRKSPRIAARTPNNLSGSNALSAENQDPSSLTNSSNTVDNRNHTSNNVATFNHESSSPTSSKIAPASEKKLKILIVDVNQKPVAGALVLQAISIALNDFNSSVNLVPGVPMTSGQLTPSAESPTQTEEIETDYQFEAPTVNEADDDDSDFDGAPVQTVVVSKHGSRGYNTLLEYKQSDENGYVMLSPAEISAISTAQLIVTHGQNYAELAVNAISKDSTTVVTLRPFNSALTSKSVLCGRVLLENQLFRNKILAIEIAELSSSFDRSSNSTVTSYFDFGPKIKIATDNQGRFVTHGLNPGKYRVRIASQGYKINPLQIEIKDRVATQADLEMVKTYQLNGTVNLPKGRSAADFALHLRKEQPEDYEKNGHNVYLNESGSFAIHNLTSDDYMIDVYHFNQVISSHKIAPEQLAPELSSKETNGVKTVSIDLTTINQFTGNLSLDGQAIGRQPINIDDPSTPGKKYTVHTDKAGNFEVYGLAPGTYDATLNVNHESYGPVATTIQLTNSGKAYVELNHIGILDCQLQGFATKQNGCKLISQNGQVIHCLNLVRHFVTEGRYLFIASSYDKIHTEEIDIKSEEITRISKSQKQNAARLVLKFDNGDKTGATPTIEVPKTVQLQISLRGYTYKVYESWRNNNSIVFTGLPNCQFKLFCNDQCVASGQLNTGERHQLDAKNLTQWPPNKNKD